MQGLIIKGSRTSHQPAKRPRKMENRNESEQRRAVIAEACTWLRTPFIHAARIKGVGADCETFLCEVFSSSGVFTARDIPYFPQQWFLHTREELYLNYLGKYAVEYQFVPGKGMTEPQAGDIICVKSKWVHSHGAIVVKWPQVVHCFPPCVMESSALFNPVFNGREMKFFNPWAVRP